MSLIFNFKKVLTASIVCGVISSVSISLQAESLPPKPDFGPMCDNEKIWKPYGVTKTQCMEAAQACDSSLSEKSLNVPEKTKLLYSCVFESLNIKLGK